MTPDQPAADPQSAAPTVWIDGHPQLEAIAAAVWEACGRSDSGACVEDDPRNIAVAALAAVLPASVDRTAVLDRIRVAVHRLAAHAVGFTDVLDESDRGPWGKTIGADIAELRRLADEVEVPLSPYYSHEACGFHWHGRDGLDIPMRDGQPVCPRCELRTVGKQLHHFEKRCEELRAESKRRGKVKLEYAEKIQSLEREIDGIQRQLGAEILRAGQAEAELRRAAGEVGTASSRSPERGGAEFKVAASSLNSDGPSGMADEAQPTQTEAAPERRLCGKSRGVSGLYYQPCARDAGHTEAYCRSADGQHLFLAAQPMDPVNILGIETQQPDPSSVGPGVAAPAVEPPPVHLGGRANAELCPACKAQSPLPWPSLCPAEPGAEAQQPEDTRP